MIRRIFLRIFFTFKSSRRRSKFGNYDGEVLVIDEEKLNGSFLGHIKLPSKNFIVKYADKVSGKSAAQFEVEHLPPLELRFELPETYPSSTCPAFTLSCPWLSLRDLTALCRKLEEMWETLHSAVLFTWFSFLRDETLSFLQYEALDITHLMTMPEMIEKTSTQREPTVQGGVRNYDERAIPSHLGIELVSQLLAYNIDRREELYNNQSHWCNMCTVLYKGDECILFDCDHITCKDCLSNYFRCQIKEGNVHDLKCPEYNCSTLATTSLIASLVSEEEFKRYDQLVLASVVASMSDVVFCPRIGCNNPVFPYDGTLLAFCRECPFAFCSNCKFTFHGVSPCRLFSNEDDRRQTLTMYKNATPEEKQELEKKYGKLQLQKALNEFLNENWITESCKPCPSCKVPIEKEYGCQKMDCSRCKTSFCFLCLTRISPDNPYAHFNDPQSPCFNQLLFGM
ncbi:E3 ubiquitin-protein ligase RNF14 [Halotydeus destructor]|nr:E3 ubiquitin-protein ligase RNF14 [Halotydeus destructor]